MSSAMTDRRPASAGTATQQKDVELRAERVARYKEERRRQLAAQFGTKLQPDTQSISVPRRFITRAKSSTPVGDGVSSGKNGDGSSSEGVAVRTTRASRLRAARLGVQENTTTSSSRRLGGAIGTSPASEMKERSPLTISAGSDASTCGTTRISRLEKDKSSKRKSNLNRALNSEDVLSPETPNDEPTSRRRRRRVLNPNDIITSLNESGLSSGSPSTSARVTPLPSPSQTPQSTTSRIPTSSSNTTRRSDLSIHMENARRGVISTDKPRSPRKLYTSSPRTKPDVTKQSSSEPEMRKQKIDSDCSSTSRKIEQKFPTTPINSTVDQTRRYSSCDEKKTKRLSGGEFVDRGVSDSERSLKVLNSDKQPRKKSVTSASPKNIDISKRMDALDALTRETLARVERLTKPNQSPHRGDNYRTKSKSPEKSLRKPEMNGNHPETEDHHNHNGFFEPSSILKRKEELTPLPPQPPPISVHIQTPVSILKRKSSQDEPSSSATTSFITPPVTFSPTVIDRKKPGILKKRCSLDESQVIRRRSYSPDVVLVEGSSDYRPILKTQRRSSLEEIIRTHSPDVAHPPGILKRKHSKGEDEFGERSLGSPEPQSILKRKSGTSSSGSSGNSPHVSIATAVILAAAGGAEIVLEPSDSVKPILKKKSFSDENPSMDSLTPDVPKPILKKKSSTETDDQDDRPMRPILKSSRKCSQDDNYSGREDFAIDSPRIQSVLRARSAHNSGESSSECETVRPILKQSSSRENSPRPRLSFCNEEESSMVRRSKFVRRSNTVAESDLSTIINIKQSFENGVEKNEEKSEQPHIPKRPISVFEMIMNFEKTVSPTSTGAIPKRSSLKGSRQSGRFRTQPITFDELEATASLESVQNFQAQSLFVDKQPSEISPSSSSSPVRLIPDATLHQTSPSHHHTQHDTSSFETTTTTTSSTQSPSNNDSQLTTPSSSSTVPNESADSGIASKTSFAMDDDVARENDDELSPQELCRSNSVSAKASMFKQLEAQMKAVAEEAKAVRLGKGNKGLQRYRNRKSTPASPSAENRFATQPVTLDEVQEAVRANQRTTESPDDEQSSSSKAVETTPNPDEPDPSKLSLAERVKLFNKKITEEHIPSAPGGGPGGAIVRKPRHARFKTQPVTTEEVVSAQRISPLAASLVKPPDADSLEGLSMRATKDKIYEHAAKILTNEVRGILKSKFAISPVVSSPSPDSDHPKTLKTCLKKESPVRTNGVGHHKPEYSDDDDEGVSTSEDTSSGSDNKLKQKKYKDFSNEKENVEMLNNKKNKDELRMKVGECMKELEGRNKVRRHLEEVQQMSSSTEGTSDGESSGGREVKRIIANEAVARRRQAAINRQKEKNNNSGPLIKSKSQSSIARDHPVSLRPPAFTRSVYLDSSTTSCAQSSGSVDDHPALGFVRGGVRRSLTLPSATTEASDEDMPGRGTIADRLAELQNSGNNEWRKRLPKLNTANDEIIQLTTIKNSYNKSLTADSLEEKSTSILAARKKLDAASQQWKTRVEVSDAVNYSVAGRMHKEVKDLTHSPLAVVAIVGDKKKRTPKATRFRSREETKPTISTPVSPQKEPLQLKFNRSISAPGIRDEEDSDSESVIPKTEGRRVIVPRPDDETFTTFFESVTTSKTSEHLEVTEEDLDSVTRHSGDLLVTKRTVKVQRKHVGTARNPIKALAARSDIKEEYTEVISGVAEREKRRINVEKLAKHSSMAIEALAGLASKEDFTAIALKKGGATTSTSLLPYKDLMLLHIKGRRHVQTRLVEPVASSINKGDNYVLITPTQVYNYIGPYSNIIEQSRGAEIAQHIQQKKDLGCKSNDVITIHEKKGKCTRAQLETFWTLLGGSPDDPIRDAGHPDEDEIYESAIIETNMVYELDDDELVPIDGFWGAVPKIEMLDSSKCLVFDFGSEMYIWSGRNVPLEQRKIAAKLAKELWEDGYNYTECGICPINSVSFLGKCSNLNIEKEDTKRPDWALICKLTQHGETILFREKFLDWPDFSRVIQVKNNDTEKSTNGSIVVKPCNVTEMLTQKVNYPDLLLEGSHLGRGVEYFDTETSRHFEITTCAVTAWHILEYEYEELPASSIGQFYTGDSYIIRWQYMITVTGRELSGKPSKHSMLGRDRCAYFCWQGKDAPLNEKGAAALLTVELDHERGPQIRVPQGQEPPAFLNLFDGKMVVHIGRREETKNEEKSRKLYLCRGELENEAHLIEVPCSMRQLRSRACFLLLNTKSGTVIIWNGSKALKTTRNIAKYLAEKIKSDPPVREFGLKHKTITILDTDEGNEIREFLEFSSSNRQLYHSLIKTHHTFTHHPRLFHLSSVSGKFKAAELHCPHQSPDQITPYPFIQSDLYSASQPTLFLLDNGYELWLWQGWWPDCDPDSDSAGSGSDSGTNADQTGSGQHRWQAERRAAMQTTLDYWQGSREKAVPAYLVWAGLEPFEFTNLFPTWSDRDDIAELNIRDGRKPGEILRVETELARLTQSTYPLVQLLQRPLPDGVDPTHLEDYLSNEDFQTLLGMTKPEFEQLPIWKQTNIKKETGLF